MKTTNLASPAPPSAHRGWKLVDATMRRHGREPYALIEALHTAQSSFGYLDKDAMSYVARSLNVPLSQVYGVSTFYHFFNLKPQGEHTCVVCMGTACYIKGGQQILEAVQRACQLKPGETTPDNKVSLLTARCLGSCGLAPALVMDGEVMGKQDQDAVLAKVEEWRRHES